MANIAVPEFDYKAQLSWCELLDELQAVEQESRALVEVAIATRGTLMENLLEGWHDIPSSYDALLS